MSETYDFKPGMEVVYFLGFRGDLPQFARVEKISRGFAVVMGDNYRMDGRPVRGGKHIRPSTPADHAALAHYQLAGKAHSAVGDLRRDAMQGWSDDRLNRLLAILNEKETP